MDAGYTATVQELHLVALHIVCAALDRALGVAPARPGGPLETRSVPDPLETRSVPDPLENARRSA